MPHKEYIIFCDESDKTGKYFSNFYGGVIVGSADYDKITRSLEQFKEKLNFYGEVKWSKVSENYLDKYVELIRYYFSFIRESKLKVRIMFTQNSNVPQGLTKEHIEMEYFILYYEFIKFSFGLEFVPLKPDGTNLRLYFDVFPHKKEKVEQFKGFLLGLVQNEKFKKARLLLKKENITEVKSHDHVILQCLDIILGSISFRLNDKHKEKALGEKRRGKKTIAKEKLYRVILSEIKQIHPNFNIGISTGIGGDPKKNFLDPYMHWKFIPKDVKYDDSKTKGRK